MTKKFYVVKFCDLMYLMYCYKITWGHQITKFFGHEVTNFNAHQKPTFIEKSQSEFSVLEQPLRCSPRQVLGKESPLFIKKMNYYQRSHLLVAQDLKLTQIKMFFIGSSAFSTLCCCGFFVCVRFNQAPIYLAAAKSHLDTIFCSLALL